MEFRNIETWVSAFLLSVLLPTTALSYEVPTHSYISSLSINRSSLSHQDTVLNDYDVKETDKFWSGLEYTFYRENVEQTTKEYFNYRDLISAGARHEDEVDDIPGGDDAFFGGKRAGNHFFDPQTNRPLQKPGINFRSPDWALEDKQKGLIYETPLGDVEQKYSLNDGMDYLYNALTLESKIDREDSFGKAFRSLGHAIHHIQDMAQPQHARLDDHCHSSEIIGKLLLNPVVFPNTCQQEHNPSFYESYSRSVQGTFGRFADAYPVPRFNSAREFYVGNLKGMSEFTSYNFISEGTNFRMLPGGEVVIHNYQRDINEVGYGLNFPSPPNVNDWIEVDSTELEPAADGTSITEGGRFSFYSSYVNDRNIPDASIYNQRSTSLSLYGNEIQEASSAEGESDAYIDFTLNKYNIDSAHEFLIPRAISYSAGLIDYFFRLRLAVENIEATSSTISFDVRNQSRLGSLGSSHTFDIESGTEFIVLYDSVSGVRRRINILESSTTSTGSEDVVTTSDIEYDSIISISAELPDDVDWAKEKPFTIVMKGSMSPTDTSANNEVGVGGIVFGLNNSIFYAIAGGNSYILSYNDGQWNAKQTDAEYKIGNVNWRGHYVNGKPTKQLSWMGATGRYFQAIRYPDDTGVIGRLREVYMDGRILARAPSPIVGAAIDMKNRLVVIGQNDIVYRTSIEDIIDLATVQWETLGTLNIPYSEMATSTDIGARSDWFFNGNGTTAVSVRKTEAWSMMRLINEYYPYNNLYWNLYVPSRMYSARIDNGVSTTEGNDNIINMSHSAYSGTMVFAADYIDDRLVTGTITVNHRDSLPRITNCPNAPQLPGCTQFPVSGSLSHIWTYHIPGRSADFFKRVIDVYAASSTNIVDTTHFVWEDVLLHCDLRYGVMMTYQARRTPGAPSPGIEMNALEVMEKDGPSVTVAGSAVTYGQGKHLYMLAPDGTLPMAFPDLRSTSVVYRGHNIFAAIGLSGEVATTVSPHLYSPPVTYLTGDANLAEVLNNPNATTGFSFVRPLK